jgi:hypothetical protein
MPGGHEETTMATIEVKVPDIGDYSDVPVIEVLVAVGDTVKKDQGLVTLESDKATWKCRPRPPAWSRKSRSSWATPCPKAPWSWCWTLKAPPKPRPRPPRRLRLQPLRPASRR